MNICWVSVVGLRLDVVGIFWFLKSFLSIKGNKDMYDSLTDFSKSTVRDKLLEEMRTPQFQALSEEKKENW